MQIGQKPQFFCLTNKLLNLSNPYHFCLVKRNNLADINLSDEYIIPRNHENMIESFNLNLEKSVSIESVENFFWKLP